MKKVNITSKSSPKATAKIGGAALLEIELITKVKRLDDGIDHLVKVIITNGESLYLPVRLDGDNAISCYSLSDNIHNELKWVSTPKKRSLKATCRLFLEIFPETLNSHTRMFHELQRDDIKSKREHTLSKREWRVHEVALFAKGYFVARLSCTKAKKEHYSDNQFVIYPAAFQDLKYPALSTKWNIYHRHGSLTSSSKVCASSIYHALRSEGSWPQLSNALKEIEYGYNTEREAKAGFKSIVSKQDYAPQCLKYGVRNAIRQHGIDKTINVEVCDRYENMREHAWIIRSESKYFIAKMDVHITGSIKILGTGFSTAFTTIEESARDLISQHMKKGSHSDTRVEVLVKWRDMIESDLRQRYFVQNLTSTWLITDVAINGGVCVALKALCLPEPSFYVPLEFQTHSFHILHIDNLVRKLVAPSPWQPKYNNFDLTIEQFDEALQSLISSPHNEVRKILEKSLQLSRGFISRTEASLAWDDLTSDFEIVRVDGDACPIPSAFNRLRLKNIIDKQRKDIVSRISDANEDCKQLLRFESRIKEITKYPKALIELGVNYGLCSEKFSQAIPTIENAFCYELTVDLFKPIVATSEKYSCSEEGNATAQIERNDLSSKEFSWPDPSMTIRNVGRKKIHKNSAERKRVWAQKDREKKRQKKIDSGIEPVKAGRTRIHQSPADKQLAYRFRMKWKQKSSDSALIYIGANQKAFGSDEMIESITTLLPYFCNENKQQILAVVPDIEESDSSHANEKITDRIPVKNVYVYSSQINYELIKRKLSRMDVNRVILCGFSITDVCYRIACYLQEIGYEPSLVKQYLHTDDKWEKEVGIKLFKKKFGKKCIT